ncbi:hypothetical protein BH23ACT12_BH23ACT12_03300 [soil metagenome]
MELERSVRHVTLLPGEAMKEFVAVGVVYVVAGNVLGGANRKVG